MGEGLNFLIPAPVPASIYAMVILFVCLCTKIIKLEAVKDAGMFLIEIMPLMFIPAGVGLMKSWGSFKTADYSGGCDNGYISYCSNGCQWADIAENY